MRLVNAILFAILAFAASTSQLGLGTPGATDQIIDREGAPCGNFGGRQWMHSESSQCLRISMPAFTLPLRLARRIVA